MIQSDNFNMEFKNKMHFQKSWKMLFQYVSVSTSVKNWGQITNEHHWPLLLCNAVFQRVTNEWKKKLQQFLQAPQIISTG